MTLPIFGFLQSSLNVAQFDALYKHIMSHSKSEYIFFSTIIIIFAYYDVYMLILHLIQLIIKSVLLFAICEGLHYYKDDIIALIYKNKVPSVTSDTDTKKML